MKNELAAIVKTRQDVILNLIQDPEKVSEYSDFCSTCMDPGSESGMTMWVAGCV